jgi:predicted RNA-binding protein with RPS1 domain
MVTDICAVAELGKTYLGKVVRIVDFGAFVEIFPGTDGLLHISEISESRTKQVRDELNEGDQILVKVLALEGNKIKLSRRAILKEQREKLKMEEAGKVSSQRSLGLRGAGGGARLLFLFFGGAFANQSSDKRAILAAIALLTSGVFISMNFSMTNFARSSSVGS